MGDDDIDHLAQEVAPGVAFKLVAGNQIEPHGARDLLRRALDAHQLVVFAERHKPPADGDCGVADDLAVLA